MPSYIVKVTRRLEEGRIPVNGAQDAPNGQFSVAEINLPSIIDARNPEENIAILNLGDDTVSATASGLHAELRDQSLCDMTEGAEGRY